MIFGLPQVQGVEKKIVFFFNVSKFETESLNQLIKCQPELKIS